MFLLIVSNFIILAIGIASTLIMDILAWLREKIFQVRPLNYAFIGRWVLYWSTGKFIHRNITQTEPKKFEHFVGWSIHYFIGILWGYIYLNLNQLYAFNINVMSTLIFSLSTTLVPFLIIQPSLGFGFFASHTPKPLTNIKNSLIAHTFFGIGLYLSYKRLMPYLIL